MSPSANSFLDKRRQKNPGRPRTQSKCKVKGCGKAAQSRNMCGTHYKQWSRKYGHLRCHWPGCQSHQDDGGRRMNGVFYCRLHESEHLRITAEAERLNTTRLGAGLTGTLDGCWLWTGSANDSGYGTFVPEGANTAQWLAHRIAWNLLCGGHKQGLELDHRTCKRRNCVNPLHLEPVTRSVNQRRKRHGPDKGWLNPDAIVDPRVKEFAERNGLPYPPESANAPIFRRRRSATLPPQTRKTSCPNQLPLKSPTPRSGISATTAIAA
jgi:hypothetical protein